MINLKRIAAITALLVLGIAFHTSAVPIQITIQPTDADFKPIENPTACPNPNFVNIRSRIWIAKATGGLLAPIPGFTQPWARWSYSIDIPVGSNEWQSMNEFGGPWGNEPFTVTADGTVFPNTFQMEIVGYDDCTGNPHTSYVIVSQRGNEGGAPALPGVDGAPGADGAAGPAGADGADGAAGATGGQGDQGKQGDAGTDTPCIECIDLSPILVEFVCKVFAAHTPTTEQAFDDAVAAILNAMTATANICGDDTAGCLAAIAQEIEDAK
jgi:hypothetical protein